LKSKKVNRDRCFPHLLYKTFAIVYNTDTEAYMKQEHIDRINVLARKAKTDGLTPEETEERDALRKAYIADFRSSLQSHLDNTYIVDRHGNKTKLQKKR